VVTDFPVVLGKSTPLMRPRRLDRVTYTEVIKITRFKVLEKYIQVRIFIFAAVSRQEKDLVWTLNVFGSKLERMCPGDPCYRVVILERLLAVRLLICRPQRESKLVKVKDRKIELGLIMQLIEQGTAPDVAET